MTAKGVTSVVSKGGRVECHGSSYYSQRDYSGKVNATGVSPRDRQRTMILKFWESQGIARYNKRAGGVWEARDLLNPERAGEWLPIATKGEESRADRMEFSHMRSTANGGAWCACNLLPEVGAVNASRGEANVDELPMAARAVLAAWPAYWTNRVARKASLARIGA